MIAAIVAVDTNYGIGNKDKLLIQIPEDMKHFKEITTKGSIIVGRKTYDTLPNKPLKDRTNIIVTRKAKKKPKVQEDGSIRSNMRYIKTWLSTEDVIKNNNGIYVIGGESIYKELLPLCERVYITKILHAFDEVDTYFPNIDEMPEWEMTSTSEIKEYDGIQYQFCVYDRVDYEIVDILVHDDNTEANIINENDMIVSVKTFNSNKTIIFSGDSNSVYIDDWEYITNKKNMNKFLDRVSDFAKTKDNEIKKRCEL